MSAAVLRKAAAAMRKRAEAATSSPWIAFRAHDRDHSKPDWIGVTRDLAVDYDSDLFVSQKCAVADAEHIASWHPVIALAVADWLDAEATSLDAMAVFGKAAATTEHEVTIRGAALTVRKDKGGGISLAADTSAPAIAVATAYLAASP